MSTIRHRDGLSIVQLRLLNICRDYKKYHGRYASVRDLQKEMGHQSPSTTLAILHLLEDKGRIERVYFTRHAFVFLPVER